MAFEGLLHFDLFRWHNAEAAHVLVTIIPVKNVGVNNIYNDTNRPETGDFLPILDTEKSSYWKIYLSKLLDGNKP